MEDDRCNNCFRLNACIIPYPEKEGILFTKVCYVCGYEEECDGRGGQLPLKNKSTQTEITSFGSWHHRMTWDNFATEINKKEEMKYRFGMKRQTQPPADSDGDFD